MSSTRVHLYGDFPNLTSYVVANPKGVKQSRPVILKVNGLLLAAMPPSQ
jgi:hypothetical protein